MLIFKIMRLPSHLSRLIQISLLKRLKSNQFSIGQGSRIASPQLINLHSSDSRLEIGKNVAVEQDTHFNILGHCEIGDGTYISIRGLIGCEEHVVIGKRVAIGPNVTIIDTNKNYGDRDKPIIEQGGKSLPIRINDDCWLGANVVVLPGAEIGAHSVVAAGAVVIGVFPSNVLIAGVPARVKKYLND